jgi:hypothetical protein
MILNCGEYIQIIHRQPFRQARAIRTRIVSLKDNMIVNLLPARAYQIDKIIYKH